MSVLLVEGEGNERDPVLVGEVVDSGGVSLDSSSGCLSMSR